MNLARLEYAPIHVELGSWLAGFIDGEGCFSIAASGNGYRCDFIVKLRADDGDLLCWLRDELDLGTVRTGEHSNPNASPYARWVVSSKRELVRLTEILDWFPLRSKKMHDYAVWREAVIFWSNSDRPVDWMPMAEWYRELRKLRAYREPALPSGEKKPQ